MIDEDGDGEQDEDEHGFVLDELETIAVAEATSFWTLATLGNLAAFVARAPTGGERVNLPAFTI